MKKIIILSIMIFLVITSSGFSQKINTYTSGNYKPGLMNITELNGGIGLYQLDRDYAKRVFNVTTIMATGLSKNLTGGIGAGISLYNGGTLVPFFADIRYYFNVGKTRCFIMGDGGIILNTAKTDGGPKYLVSPGAGVVFPVTKSMSVNLGTFLFTQFGDKEYGHDSFANLKLGITYFL